MVAGSVDYKQLVAEKLGVQDEHVLVVVELVGHPRRRRRSMCPHGDRRLPACSLRPSHDADRQLAQLERQDERLLGEERLIKRLMETPGQRHRRRTEETQPDEGVKYISGSGGRLANTTRVVSV